MGHEFLKHLDQQIDPSRRAFFKKLAAAGAAAPVIASFSIEALTASAQIAPPNSLSQTSLMPSSGTGTGTGTSSGSGGGGGNPCPVDQGYVGPGRFAAHLSASSSSYAPGTNGEMTLVVNDRDHDEGQGRDKDDHGKDQRRGRSAQARGVRVRIKLVSGAVFDSAQILVNGSVVVNLPSADYRFEAADVTTAGCDLDYVLNACASGTATAVVLASNLGPVFTMVGPIAPVGPGFEVIDLDS